MTDPAERDVATTTRAGRPPAPKSVRLAVAGIFVLAALSLVGIWLVFDPAYRSSVGTSLYQSSSGALVGTALDAARSVALVVVGVGSTVVAIVLVWLAFKVWAGHRWARLVVTVVVAVGLFYTLRNVFVADHHPQPIGQAVELVDVLVRVAMLALLWAPEDARAFFQ